MTEQSERDAERWRLGPDPADSLGASTEPSSEGARVEGARGRGYAPLDRALYVLTVERAAFVAVALWALATRLLGLAMRPLSGLEAAHALLDLQIAEAGRDALKVAADPLSTLTHLMNAGLFNLAAPDDFSARLTFALYGLLLVVIAFTMRPWLGRAGTIAFAALLAASPSLTWFSRTSAAPIAAATFTLLAFRIGLRFFTEATALNGLAFGLSVGAALSISPDLFPTLVLFALAAVLSGLYELLFAREFGERLLFWVTHNIRFLIVAFLSAIVVWLTLATGLFAHPPPLFDSQMLAVWDLAGYRSGWHFLLPVLGLYEFLTVLLAVAGLGLFVALRIRSRFVGWASLWAGLALLFLPLCPVHNYLILLQMLLPLSLMAAIAVDFCYRSEAWEFIRYPLAALGAFTVYIQLMANFVYPVADAAEPRSNRHAPLFWTEAATTVGTRDVSNKVEDLYDNQGTLASRSFFDSADSPALEWYLRDLNPADKQQGADVTDLVDESAALGETSPEADRLNVTFDLQDSWHPDLGAASVADLVRYLLTMRVWGTVEPHQVTLSYATKGTPSAKETSSPSATSEESAEAPSATREATPEVSASPQAESSVSAGLPSPTPASSVASAVPAPIPTSTVGAASPPPP